MDYPGFMRQDIREFIERSRFHLATVQEMAGRLPADDAELDAWVAEAVRENDFKAFMHLLVAALSVERRVDARHLARGAMMLPYHQWLGCAAWHMQGDVPEHLLDAIQHTRLKPEMEAAGLFVAAAWCQERRGGALPAGLISAARLLARREPLDTPEKGFLLALALRIGDAGLTAVLKHWDPAGDPAKWKALEEAARGMGESYLAVCRKPILGLVREKPSDRLTSGTTLRRAVARIGRNETCPCGSGKKYKHCCLEKDQERLHHSSEVAGRTLEELHAELERHLTAERLDRVEPYELARLDPRKIDPSLHDQYFHRLAAFALLDTATEGLEKLTWSDALNEAWIAVMFHATKAGRQDLAQRLVRLRPDAKTVEQDLAVGSALLLAEGDPARQLAILDQCAREALQTDDPRVLEGFAHGLLVSKLSALGLFVARSMVPIVPRETASFLFEQILQARDRLNLPPDDAFGDILDRRLLDAQPDDGKDAAALREAQRRLDDKAKEVRQLKESLERLQKEVARRERTASAPALAPAETVPVDERPLRELRQKVEGLKSALKDRHLERNALRRELQQAHADLETLRQTAPPATPRLSEPEGGEHEEDWLLPQDAPEIQPVRLIEFPRGFQQTLGGFPRPVARAALTLVGRLAAGEPAAFVGALRLKGCPNVTRQRIGADFRLLFQLLPDRVRVLDLINRKDLERKIRTLL